MKMSLSKFDIQKLIKEKVLFRNFNKSFSFNFPFRPSRLARRDLARFEARRDLVPASNIESSRTYYTLVYLWSTQTFTRKLLVGVPTFGTTVSDLSLSIRD